MTPLQSAKEVASNITRSSTVSLALVLTLIGSVGGGGLAVGMLVSKVNSIDGIEKTMRNNHAEVIDKISDLGRRITIVETTIKQKG